MKPPLEPPVPSVPAKLCGALGVWVALLLTGALPAAERLPAPGELAALYKPFHVGQVALAPDGRHLAYTVQEGTLLFVMVMEVDRPDRKATLMIGENVTVGLFQRRVMLAARVTHLRWVGGDRLVYGISVPNADDRTLVRDEIRVVDADGKNDRKLVDGQMLEEMWSPPGGGRGGSPPPVQYIPRRLRVLDVRADDPGVIFVEATGGREIKSELFKISLATAKFESLFAGEDDGRYLYDQQGRPRVLETPHFVMPQGGGGGGGRRGGGGGGRRGGGMMAAGPMLVPQVYRYRAAEAKRGWDDLDRFLGKEPALAFRDTPGNYYGQRSFPVAFDVDPNVLYFASNVGRDTYGLYALDVRTKQRRDFAVEDAGFDVFDPGDAFATSALVFDRQGRLAGVRLPGTRAETRWLDPVLAKLQVAIEAKLPERDVEILDWDETCTRVFVLVTRAGDPGRYFMFQGGPPAQLTEFFRRAPWLPMDALNTTAPFAFDTPAGVHLTGTLTLPRHSRISPAPLLLVCRELPGRRERPGFNRDIEALADMGFVVAQVNYRGAAGFGAAHRDAAKEGYDRIPIEDLRATVKWISTNYQVNTRRTALVGQGFGGYLALRAVQLFPGEFRCAVSINAPAEPAAWLNEPLVSDSGTSLPSFEFELRQAFFDRARVADIGLTKHAATTGQPVFIIQDTERRDLWESQGTSLRNALKRHGLDVEYLETTMEFSRGEAEARAKVFSKIAGFLNDHVYDYGVDVGEAKEVK